MPAGSQSGKDRMDRVDRRDIAMIGFGEAARAFVRGWGDRVAGRLAAHDIKCADGAARPAMEAAAAALGLDCHAAPAAALGTASIVFCLVTADRRWPPPRRLPRTCRKARSGWTAIRARPAASAPPRRSSRRPAGAMSTWRSWHRCTRRCTASLLSGPHAEDAQAVLAGLDMNVRVAGGRIGDASSIKMLRSVMIKGFEALTAECLLAAHRAGVEEAVLASLQASDPGWDWAKRGAYDLERMLVHGARRAAEMREAAATLREPACRIAWPPRPPTWQDEIAALGLPGGEGDLADQVERMVPDEVQ